MNKKIKYIAVMLAMQATIAHAQTPVEESTDGFSSPTEASQRDEKIWGRDTTTNTEKIIPIGSFAWTIDQRFGNITPADIDTIPNNFQNFNLTDGPTGQYNFLGNLGSPRLSRLYMQRKPLGTFLFAHPFDYFYTPIEEFQFTNTLSPITNLSYHSCGNKQNGEDRIRVYFASNINKIAGIGLKADYLYGRGYYLNQATSLFNGSIYGYYLGDHYNMHSWISINHMRLGENGGISEDNYITHPEDYTRSFGSRDIPTNLSQYWNRNEDQTYQLNHRYNLGFYKEVQLPDSLRPVLPSDSTLLAAITDSLSRVRLATDTAYLHAMTDSLKADFWARQDIPQEFVPVTSFIHTLRIRNTKHTVYSYNTPSDYYTTMYYGDLNDMRDRTRAYNIENTLGISLREGFNRWAKAGLTAFATHEFRHFTLPGLLADGVNTFEQGYSEQNLSVGGQLSKRQGTTLHYDITGEAVVLGQDVGSFNVAGAGDLNFKLWNDTVQLQAKAFIKHQEPSFYLRHYHTQFAWWDNDLSKEFTTRIEGSLSLKRTRSRLTVGVENVKNYTYFAMQKTALMGEDGAATGNYSQAVHVRQYSPSVQVFSAKLNQDFKFGIFNWENEVAYQKSSNETVIPLPTISAYSNLYLVFRIAKVLRVQLGADVRYFTRYYAPDYAPIVQQFAIQDESTRIKIGNYPICNAYINFHLKHCRFYVNAHHINDGTGNRQAFLAPHYPINPMNIHFGLSWNFFN